MNTNLAIIGSHKVTRGDYRPRPGFDVWVFNEAVSRGEDFAKDATAVFQMHLPVIWRNPRNRNDPRHYDWLKSQAALDIWMIDKFEDVPRSRRYPLDDVLAMLGPEWADHFLTSSPAQAIALGILLGYKKIEIYGVVMESNTEYQFQRDGVAFWMGFAKGRGVDLSFSSDTYRGPVYGFEGSIEVPYSLFVDRMTELRPQIDDLSRQYKDALHVVDSAIKAFSSDASAGNEKALYSAIEKQKLAADALGLVDGQYQENERYKGKADAMIEQSGSFIFSRQEFEAGAKSFLDAAEDKHVDLISFGTKLDMAQRAISQSGGPKRGVFVGTFRGTLVEYLKAANAEAVLKGKSKENFSLMAYLDKSIRAAGGASAEQVLRDLLPAEQVQQEAAA